MGDANNYFPPVKYDVAVSSTTEPGHYNITHTDWRDDPAMHCKYLKGLPCPASKSSYWRSFATDLNNGGCGEPKRVCGASPFPKMGMPHYQVQPAAKSDLIKFF